MESLLERFDRVSVLDSSTGHSISSAINAIAQRAVYTTKVKGDPFSIITIIEISLHNSADAGIAAIETARVLWAKPNSEEALGALADAYIRGIELSESSDVRCACLSGLGEALSQTIRLTSKSKTRILKEMVLPQHMLQPKSKRGKKIESLGTLLEHGKQTPALTNAEILASGSMLLYRVTTRLDGDGSALAPQISPSEEIQKWGELMVMSGDATKVCPYLQWASLC